MFNFFSSSKATSSHSSFSPNPNAPPGPQDDDNGVRVEAKGVYMILWRTDLPRKYHWGVLVATTETQGFLFHQNFSGTLWRYVVEPKNITKSGRLLVALKLGVVPDVTDEWMGAMKNCIRSTEVPGSEFTCRTWALAAVYELANCGFIGMLPDWEVIDKIEEEAKDLAIHALDTDQKYVAVSEQSRP
ncbi:hypothetical protein MaudCBS49596_001084 [Microsporum audouinii]